MRVAGSVADDCRRYRDSFIHARPFKHAVIENFFEPDFAERLLADFPAFNPALAANEIYGGVWGKAVNTRIKQISPAYEELYELIGSGDFLDLMSRVTDVAGLLPDPALYGGGTHENLHGQDLDPHVDFNYDEPQKLHRRLNLIVFLNKGWKGDWGGSLEIHSNPRRPAENQIQSYEPVFNRAVLFETNEHSWHGFPKIELPEEERHRSRKSISIYLYTRERPAEEAAPPHGTFYVHRPLDKRFKTGYMLTESDEKDLLFQVDRRDKWIEKYQQMELDRGRELQQKIAYISELLSRVRAPITGYALQEGTSKGLYADGWVSTDVRVTLRPLKPVVEFIMRGWRPDYAGSAEITITVSDESAVTAKVDHGLFEIPVTPDGPIELPFVLEISCQPAFQAPGDDRPLAFVLIEIRAEHTVPVT
jgi:hypothetical protein